MRRNSKLLELMKKVLYSIYTNLICLQSRILRNKIVYRGGKAQKRQQSTKYLGFTKNLTFQWSIMHRQNEE